MDKNIKQTGMDVCGRYLGSFGWILVALLLKSNLFGAAVVMSIPMNVNNGTLVNLSTANPIAGYSGKYVLLETDGNMYNNGFELGTPSAASYWNADPQYITHETLDPRTGSYAEATYYGYVPTFDGVVTKSASAILSTGETKDITPNVDLDWHSYTILGGGNAVKWQPSTLEIVSTLTGSTCSINTSFISNSFYASGGNMTIYDKGYGAGVENRQYNINFDDISGGCINYELSGTWESADTRLGQVSSWLPFTSTSSRVQTGQTITTEIKTATSEAGLASATYHGITSSMTPSELTGADIWCKTKLTLTTTDAMVTPTFTGYTLRYNSIVPGQYDKTYWATYSSATYSWEVPWTFHWYGNLVASGTIVSPTIDDIYTNVLGTWTYLLDAVVVSSATEALARIDADNVLRNDVAITTTSLKSLYDNNASTDTQHWTLLYNIASTNTLQWTNYYNLASTGTALWTFYEVQKGTNTDLYTKTLTNTSNITDNYNVLESSVTTLFNGSPDTTKIFKDGSGTNESVTVGSGTINNNFMVKGNFYTTSDMDMGTNDIWNITQIGRVDPVVSPLSGAKFNFNGFYIEATTVDSGVETETVSFGPYGVTFFTSGAYGIYWQGAGPAPHGMYYNGREIYISTAVSITGTLDMNGQVINDCPSIINYDTNVSSIAPLWAWAYTSSNTIWIQLNSQNTRLNNIDISSPTIFSALLPIPSTNTALWTNYNNNASTDTAQWTWIYATSNTIWIQLNSQNTRLNNADVSSATINSDINAMKVVDANFTISSNSINSTSVNYGTRLTDFTTSSNSVNATLIGYGTRLGNFDISSNSVNATLVSYGTNKYDKTGGTISGNVMVGTTTLPLELHSNNQNILSLNRGSGKTMFVKSANSDNLLIDIGGKEVYSFIFNADSSLTASPTYDVTVGATNRDLYIDNTGLIGYVSSSKRGKNNIEPMENIDWFYQLNPVNFTYKKDSLGIKQYGLIAEEVAEVNPLMITYETKSRTWSKTESRYQVECSTQPQTVEYGKFIPIMIKAIQDQEKQIADLQERVNKLEGK